jgi:hypothetical protein
MTTRILGIVVAVACSVSGTAEATTNLKPFDPVALQGVAETTAKELLLPGAMVLLRTPQGDFAFGYGATELGGTIPPRADTHFRAARTPKRQNLRKASIMTRAGFGRRRNCSPSRSSVRVYSLRVRNTTIATPTMPCSVSSLKNLKVRRSQKFFRIVCSGR